MLEAREEAGTQLGGTRARAERVFVRAVLQEFDSLRGVERGACEIALPSTLPPSFESRRSAIRWLVRFAGTEPRRRWWELTWMDKEFEVSLGGGEGWGDPGGAPPA